MSIFCQIKPRQYPECITHTHIHVRTLATFVSDNLSMYVFCGSLQVCEEYKLHRETYYLAIDMHDRFLDTQKCIQKEHLQAIGITCLFIASKIEVGHASICVYTHTPKGYFMSFHNVSLL